MPSNKPQILIRTSITTKEKLNRIAQENKRSMGNMAEVIIEEYISRYEKENGTVNISFNDHAQNNGNINIEK